MSTRVFKPLAMALTVALFFAVFSVTSSFAARLTPAQKRGKQLYLKTTSPSGREIKAYVTEGAIEAPGSAMPCVNCHHYDGQGLDEVGVTATNVTWEDLTRPYRIKRSKGRVHPPYTEETLARAIREGIDPAGNTLEYSMPRYEISDEELADLIAYLKIIGSVMDPGLSEDAIRVGTVLPLTGRLADLGRVMQRIIEAYFHQINASGGIYTRKLELRVAEYAGTPQSTLATFKQLVDEQETFALVSAFTSGADAEVAGLIEDGEVPLIGPFTLFPEDIFALNRFTFYLFSGLREQARALVAYAQQTLPGPNRRVAVVYPREKVAKDIVAAVERQGTQSEWGAIASIAYASGRLQASDLAQQLRGDGTEAVFFLGAWEELRALLLQAVKVNWTPNICISGSQAKRDVFELPLVFTHKVFLAYPSLPQDHKTAGRQELGRLFEKYDLSKEHLTAQIFAYCAAKILVEGIKRAGRKLSREKLVTALENLYEFDTGLTPRITYDPNRRIGALGAYIVTVDLHNKSFVPVSGWIALD
ncbi:MAG: ABC transporter substrate-binding protein [Desulfobacterales bacterium]|nr:MAG: ABC transporter substrate-binding protein [Desulfobacterales bacterium]